MRRSSKLLVAFGFGVAAATLLSAQGQQSAISRTENAASTAAPADHVGQKALLDRYCAGCHSASAKTPPGGVVLQNANLEVIPQNAELWERVVRKLRSGTMPPAGRPRPDGAVVDQWASAVETELDQYAIAHPNPGKTEALHRLNRTEYHNAIRDLVSLDVDVSTLLPTDDASYGFDNIAGVLKLNQSLMERYLSAARRISRLAIGTAGSSPISETYRISDEASQYDHIEGLPFGTRGGLLIRHNFPQDGEYTFHVEFLGSKVEAAGYDASSGFADTHQLEVLLDGDRLGNATLEPKPLRRLEGTAPSGFELKAHVPAGLHEVGVTFMALPTIEEADGIRVRFMKPQFQSFMVPPNLAVYEPFVDSLTIGGPFKPTGPGETASRRRIFICRPASADKEEACARQIVTVLARRAFRRPVTPTEAEDLVKFYRSGRTDTGGTFETGIELALRRILVSVDFLFRLEIPPTSGAKSADSGLGSTGTVLANVSTRRSAAGQSAADGGGIYRVSDHELATRLSFFLWSSIPDDELLTLADRGKLKDPAILEKQVKRMLADPRAQTLVDNFAVQWLQLRKLQTIRPDQVMFPDFDDSLRDAFIRETQFFIDSTRRADQSVLDLLDAPYTFVNERLAMHYSVPNIQGSHFRRYDLPPNSPRRGLLGQGSILTLTSMPNRTSPVVRGKWILENILGSPPPDPPANVPPLPEPQGSAAPATMRERMSQHRANPVCASCHSVIDPLGFALENFDAVGRYRSSDDGSKAIDASGTLPDGSKFANAAGLRAALLAHPDRFVTTFTEKLMTYALGRGLEYYDRPSIRAIVHSAAADNYKWSSIVAGIIRSVPFQMRRSVSS